MTIQEFSDQFDVLYNNITSNQAPGLTEYEKSVFLTKAQSQLVREYFNARVDSVGGGFDGSQKRQYDFSGLIRTENLYNVNTYANRIEDLEKLDRRSLIFLMPWNYFLSVNEILSDSRWQYSVLPIDYAEYQRLMLKPYNLPVKRAAWRLNTDKKNCNFWQKFVTAEDNYGETYDTPTNYMFTSTWADEKRNLEITIVRDSPSTPIISGNNNAILIRDNRIIYPSTIRYRRDAEDAGGSSRLEYRNMEILERGWKKGGLTYEIKISVDHDVEDDHDAIESIKQGFKALKQYLKDRNVDIGDYDEGAYEDLVKACRHTDGFAQASAPSKFTEFKTAAGLTFTTSVIQLPFVEIIGKFRGDVQYQMRYVRALEPIILENLTNYGDDLTIEGVRQVAECRLPKECHEEILERAVTLAKIAWQGGTSTQAQAASRERDRDR